MEWSFSQGATYTRCPRQWFYKYRFANALAKREPLRREAYLLSKLDTVWAWRGKVVTYALALARGRPHKDFPNRSKRFSAEELSLLEVQLQRGIVRQYVLTEEDIENVEEHIYRSASQIAKAHGEDASSLSAANYAGTCRNCGFQSICWEAD